MNFIDRTALGEKLAQSVHQFYNKDAVIVCLQEGSLLTCLTMAKQLHAWIYPLIYQPVYTPGHDRKLLGAFDADGDFCALAGSQPPETEAEAGIESAAKAKEPTKRQRTSALKAIEKQIAGYNMEIDKHILDGRDVILAADILTDSLPLIVAQKLLKDVSPKSLTAVIGNATPQTAQLVRISAGQSEIMDIISGIYFDADRYFEHPDTYTAEQKHTLTQNIATYWQ